MAHIDKFKGSGQCVEEWVSLYKTITALLYKGAALTMLPLYLRDPVNAWYANISETQKYFCL